MKAAILSELRTLSKLDIKLEFENVLIRAPSFKSDI